MVVLGPEDRIDLPTRDLGLAPQRRTSPSALAPEVHPVLCCGSVVLNRVVIGLGFGGDRMSLWLLAIAGGSI